jgi:hypothetical protein
MFEKKQPDDEGLRNSQVIVFKYNIPTGPPWKWSQHAKNTIISKMRFGK